MFLAHIPTQAPSVSLEIPKNTEVTPKKRGARQKKTKIGIY